MYMSPWTSKIIFIEEKSPMPRVHISLEGGGGEGEGGGDETEKEASTGGEDGSSSSSSSASSDTGTTATNSSGVLPSSDDLAMKSVKWNGLRNRIASTIGIVASLVGLSYYFREDGLLIFVIVL